MKRHRLIAVLALGLAFTGRARAIPIAFDNSADLGANTTASYNCIGTYSTVLHVFVGSSGLGSLPSAATYNGVAMTLLNADDQGVSGRATWFTLAAPASGANNVGITFAGATPVLYDVFAISYDNVVSTSAGVLPNNAASTTLSFGQPLNSAYGVWQVAGMVSLAGLGSGTWTATYETVRQSGATSAAVPSHAIIDATKNGFPITPGVVGTCSTSAFLTGASIEMVPVTVGVLKNYIGLAGSTLNGFNQFLLDDSTKALTVQPNPILTPVALGSYKGFSYQPDGLGFAVCMTNSPGLVPYGTLGGVPVPSPVPVRTPSGLQNCVAQSPCGDRVAVGSNSGVVTIYDRSTGVYLTITSNSPGDGAANAIAYSPDCSSLAVAENHIIIFKDNGPTLTRWTSITTTAGTYGALAWSPDGKTLAFGWGTLPFLGSLAVDTVAMTAAPNPSPVATMGAAISSVRGTAWDLGGNTLVVISSVSSGNNLVQSAAFNKTTGVFTNNATSTAGSFTSNGRSVVALKNGTDFAFGLSAAPWGPWTLGMRLLGVFTPNPTLVATIQGNGTFPGQGIDAMQRDESFTPTPTATPSSTPTPTVTPTNSPTATPSVTATSTASPTPTITPTWSFTSTVSQTPTFTSTVTPSNTPTSTATPTSTITPSATCTITSTSTSTSTATPTITPSATPTVTPTSTATVFYLTGMHGLSSSAGVAVGELGYYVTDDEQDLVQHYDTMGNYVSTFGSHGSGPGQLDFGGAELAFVGAAVDPSNILWVADPGNNRVVSFNPDGTPGLVLGASTLSNPADVAVGPGNSLYVTDADNGRVVVFDRTTGAVSFTWGNSSCTSGDYDFCLPLGITVNGSSVYVADAGSGRVQIYDLSGVYQSTVGCRGLDPCLNTPIKASLDGSGNIWVTDQGQISIHEYDPSGTLIQIFYDFSGSVRWDSPTGSARGFLNAILFADNIDNKVWTNGAYQVSATITQTATSTVTPSSTPSVTFTRTATATASPSPGTPTKTSTAGPSATVTVTITPVCANAGNTNVETFGIYGFPMWEGNRYALPAGKVDQFAIYVNAGGSSIQMALYADAAGRPGSLVCHSGVATASAGWNYLTATTTTFSAGNYWILFQASDFESRAVGRPGEDTFVQRYSPGFPPVFVPPPSTLSGIVYPKKYTFSAYAQVCNF